MSAKQAVSLLGAAVLGVAVSSPGCDGTKDAVVTSVAVLATWLVLPLAVWAALGMVGAGLRWRREYLAAVAALRGDGDAE